AYLLPIYDEYLIAYKDRKAVADPASASRATAAIDGYAHWLIVDGLFTGTWRRAETPAGIDVHVTPHRPLTETEKEALVDAADRYSGFLGRTVHTAFRPIAG
ncbi:MAG: winged helix DNA-binding domain-containing protein, partial [Vicinamibacteria bacterium]|nr:winged helix DNA-binding domain-containing protein [Vicinamibacteria bacterium]